VPSLRQKIRRRSTAQRGEVRELEILLRQATYYGDEWFRSVCRAGLGRAVNILSQRRFA